MPKKLCIGFIAHTPREYIVYFGRDVTMDALKTIVTTIANIQELHLTSGRVVDGFLLPDPDEPVVKGNCSHRSDAYIWKIYTRTTGVPCYPTSPIELLVVRRSHSLPLGDAIISVRMC